MQNAAYSIYGHSSYGPSFGNGQDILINNGAGNNSTTNFPTAYNNGLGGAGQSTYSYLAGCHSGNTFKVLEYEVYQLIY